MDIFNSLGNLIIASPETLLNTYDLSFYMNPRFHGVFPKQIGTPAVVSPRGDGVRDKGPIGITR